MHRLINVNCAQARIKIAKRGLAAGIDLEADVKAVKSLASSWEAELQAASSKDVRYPAYYDKPFHAYDEGNLNWEAAFQVPCTSALHALYCSTFHMSQMTLE